MALAETANLLVKLSLGGSFARDLNKVNRSLGSFDARVDKTASRSFRAGQQIGTGIKNAAKIAAVGIGFLALNVEQGLDSLVKLESQTEATNAAIKATRGVAGITASEVRRLAESFESMNAIIGDEVIQSAENMLLAFTNIRKKAFKPTLQAVLDLNAGMGRGAEGLTQTAKLLGIALNDPTKGLTRLSRAGVQFTAAQIKRIKSLQKENKLYEAQQIILGEVEKRFGGRFAAFGGETARKVAKFKDSIEDLQRTLAVGLLPVVSNVADALSKLLADPAVQRDVAKFGQDLGKFFSKENITKAFTALGDVISTIRSAMPVIVGAAQAIGSVVGKAVGLFNSLPGPLKSILAGGFVLNKLTGGLVTNLGGGLIEKLLGRSALGALFSRGASPANPMWVAMAGGLPGGGLPTGAPPGGPGGGGPITPAIGAGIFLPGGYIEKKWDEFRTHLVPPTLSGKARDDINKQGINAHDLISAVKEGLAKSHPTFPKEHAVPANVATHPNMAPTVHTNVNAHDAIAAIKDQTSRVTSAVNALDPKLDQIHTGFDHLWRNMNTADIVRGWSQIEDRRGQAESDHLTAIKESTTTSALTTQGVVRTASDSNASRIVGATQSQTGAIVSAIWAARPIINVTNITKTTTIQQRYGPSNGSYGTDSGANPGK